MSKPEKTSGTKSDWAKVGPCLYRYKGRTYYALVRHAGKQIRQSLETTDAALAKRRLTKFKSDLEKVDPEVARRSLDAHRLIYEKTISGAASTQTITRLSIRRLVEEWPKESPRELRKIKPTDIKVWLKQYEGLSASTYNHMITDARRFFESAMEDGVLPENPMERIKYRKIPKIVRLTPTTEQFEAIVSNLRSQSANGHGGHRIPPTRWSWRAALALARLSLRAYNGSISTLKRELSRFSERKPPRRSQSQFIQQPGRS